MEIPFTTRNGKKLYKLTRFYQALDLPPVYLIMTGFILLLRISFVWLMGAMPQDGYYNFYAEHPALSYFDHPPAIAYLLRFFTTIFGVNVFAVKLADTITTFISALLFYRFAKMFLSRNRAGLSLLLFISTLMYSILSLVSTPDVPLVLFWTVSLIYLHRAVFSGKLLYWFLAGAATGLAFDSKYSAVFLVAGLFIFLILCKPYRKLLASYRVIVFLISFLIVASPVIIWNIQNHFISFKFQSLNRLHSESGSHFSVLNFFGVIGHQCGILLPVAFTAIIFFLCKFLKKYGLKFQQIAPQNLFLLSFFIPLFAGFIFLSPFYWIKLNWMMPAYVSGLVWLAIYIPKKWIRWQIIISFIAHFLLGLEVLFYLVPIKSEDTWFGWNQLAMQVKKLQTSNPAAFIFSAKSYKTSAMLDFYLQEPVYGSNIIGQPGLQFDLVYKNLTTLAGRDAFLILCDPNFKSVEKNPGTPEHLDNYFTSVTQLPPIIINNYNRPIRKFLIYYCHNYQPKPLP